MDGRRAIGVTARTARRSHKWLAPIVALFTLGALLAGSPAASAAPTCTSWDYTTSPNVGPGDNYLEGVDATSTCDAWAVGYDKSPTARTLTAHWDGTSWSVVSSPDESLGDNYLYAVRELSPTDVWAVGEFDTGSALQTLVENWNGSTWALVSSPSPGASRNALYAVRGSSPTNVWAVGYSYTNGLSDRTLIEHWNGSTWTVTPSPNVGA